MKKGSCTFYPGCPPCFGLCDTEHAPYDIGDNKVCDGCETCRAEKAKGNSKDKRVVCPHCKKEFPCEGRTYDIPMV